MYTKSLSAMFGEGSIDYENRTVRGLFTDDNVDEQGHMIDRAAMEKAIDEYRQWGNVRDMHGKPVGLALSVGEEAWNTVVAKIFDDEVWKMIANKVYRGFSIGAMVTGGKMVKVADIAEEKFSGISGAVRGAIKRAGEVFVITELTLVEISVVDRPANPRAIFAKSADGTEVMALPSVTKQAGVDVIKSMIIGEVDEDVDDDSVEVTITEENMEDVQDDVVDVEAEQEADAVEAEVEVEKSMDAEEPSSDEAESDVNENEVVDEDVADEVDESEIEELDEDVADEVDVEVSKLIDAVKGLTDVVKELVEKVGDSADKAIELSDEQIVKLAQTVSEKIVVQRKSAVYGVDNEADQEPEKVDLKAMGVGDLSNLIVNSVARRAVKQ